MFIYLGIPKNNTMKTNLFLSDMQVGAKFYTEGMDMQCNPVLVKTELIAKESGQTYLVKSGGITFKVFDNEQVYLKK